MQYGYNLGVVSSRRCIVLHLTSRGKYQGTLQGKLQGTFLVQDGSVGQYGNPQRTSARSIGIVPYRSGDGQRRPTSIAPCTSPSLLSFPPPTPYFFWFSRLAHIVEREAIRGET